VAQGLEPWRVLVETGAFALTVAAAYAAAYGAAAAWYGLVLRAPAAVRERGRLPAAWFLFNAYLVGGLLAHGALPTTPRALLGATALLLALTLPLWAWSRWRGRRGARPPARALVLAAALPWTAAWIAQWILP